MEITSTIHYDKHETIQNTPTRESHAITVRPLVVWDVYLHAYHGVRVRLSAQVAGIRLEIEALICFSSFSLPAVQGSSYLLVATPLFDDMLYLLSANIGSFFHQLIYLC